jgi:HSP20 family protein
MRMPRRKRKDDWDDMFESFDADMAEMRERMDELLERMMSGSVSEARDPQIYGISMRVRPDGEPLIQEFGNAGRAELSDAALPVREPLTDIRKDTDKVTVIMELPGVDKKDIKVTAEDRYLDLEVDSPDKRYTKHLELPCEVLPDSAKANYKNGVLEVVMRRPASKRRRKTTVRVD